MGTSSSTTRAPTRIFPAYSPAAIWSTVGTARRSPLPAQAALPPSTPNTTSRREDLPRTSDRTLQYPPPPQSRLRSRFSGSVRSGRHGNHLAMHVADGGQGVVDGPVFTQIQVKQFDAPPIFSRDNAHLVLDLNELRRHVLATGVHVDLGAFILERHEGTRALQILQQTGGEGRRQQLRRPRKPGRLLGGPAGVDRNALVAGSDGRLSPGDASALHAVALRWGGHEARILGPHVRRTGSLVALHRHPSIYWGDRHLTHVTRTTAAKERCTHDKHPDLRTGTLLRHGHLRRRRRPAAHHVLGRHGLG